MSENPPFPLDILKFLSDVEWSTQVTVEEPLKQLNFPIQQLPKGPARLLYEFISQTQGTTTKPNAVIQQQEATLQITP